MNTWIPTKSCSYSTSHSKVTIRFILLHFVWDQYVIPLQAFEIHRLSWLNPFFEAFTKIYYFSAKNSCFKYSPSFQYNRCCSKNIAAFTKRLFSDDWYSQISWRKLRFNVRKIKYRWKNGLVQVISRNNVSTFERTHNWNKPFSEINMLLLKELLIQWMTASFAI